MVAVTRRRVYAPTKPIANVSSDSRLTHGRSCARAMKGPKMAMALSLRLIAKVPRERP
jgi:hypothetical protein